MKQKRWDGRLWQLTSTLLTLALVACGGGGGGGGGTPSPVLDVTPLTMAFTAAAPGTIPATQNITVKNTGATATTLTWTATESIAWLSLNQTTGTLTGGQSATLTVTTDTTSLAYGSTNSGTISISAAGLPTKTVNVTLTISAEPQPQLSTDLNALTFTAPAEAGVAPAPQTLIVSNSGAAGSSLSWSISGTQSWLSASPTSGTLGSGQADTLTISTDISGLTMGTYSDTLTVSAPGQTDRTVAVQLTIGAALSANPTTLSFTVTQGSNPADQSATIANASAISTTWTATSDQQWLTVTPSSGSLAAGGQAVLSTVHVNSQSLSAAVYTGTITITPGSGSISGLTIPVTLTVSAPAAAASANIFIGGTAGVTQLSSLVAAKAVQKAAVAQQQVLTDAKVTITVIKNDGSQSVTLTKTDDKGAYSAQVKVVVGDTVTVSIEKDGYTTLTKTITVKSTDAGQFTVSGNVAEATPQVIQSQGGAFKAGGGTGPGFRFGLTRNRSGQLAPFASAGEVRAAAGAGGSPELDISIPQSWAPDATAITAQLAAFNPNNATERQMFPGEFKGIGGGSASAAKADTTEYALESVSFFQTKVTPNTGQPLAPTLATGASKAAAEPTMIYKYIPTEGCTAIKKYSDRDGDPSNGIQVPLYTYNPNSGKWGYLGEGTLKTWNGSGYDTVMAAIADLACGSTDYYFEIVATEWYTWWNLDYPLLTTLPVTTCISGTVKDAAGQPISGAFIEADGYANGGSSYFYGYSNSDGSFSFDVILGANETVANYRFTAYSYATWPASYASFTPTPPSDGSCAPANGTIITISDGLACRISGKILEETSSGTIPFAGTWVEAYSNNYNYYNWAETAADGSFSLKSTCNEPITLQAWGQTLAVNVNGVPTGSESSDDATNVILKDIKKSNAPPEIGTWVWPNPAKQGKPVELSAWAWDFEGDYPLTFSWSVNNDTGGASVASSALENFPWTPASSGNFTATVTVTDSKGNAASASESIEVNPAGNTAPVIWWTWAEGSQSCGSSLLYGDAYDPDGNPLTYAWQAQATDGSWSALTGDWNVFDASGTPQPVATGFSYNGYWDNFSPATAPSGRVRMAVSDGTATVFRRVDLPAAGGLVLYYAEAWPLNAVKGNAVELYAYAWDDLGAPTYTWTVVDAGGNPVTVTPFNLGDDTWVSFTPASEGSYQVTLTVAGTCGSQVRTFTVNVAPTNGAIVIIE